MLSMPKTLVLAALLALLFTVACASMSLEDYAEECGDWVDDYGYLDFRSSYVSDMEEALEEWDALSPPGEVKALHDNTAEALRLGLRIAEEGESVQDLLDDLRDELDDAPRRQREDIRDEMDDLQDDYEDLVEDLWDRLEDLGEDYQDELEDLPRSVERDLEDEDCI